MKHLYALLVSALLVFASCETPIDLDLSSSEARLLVLSHFTVNNALQVVVGTTRSLDSQSPDQYALNATVSLYDGDELLEVLDFVQLDGSIAIPSYYTTTATTPEQGKDYTIRVEVPGFETIYATNSIPFSANISNINVGFNTVTDAFNIQDLDFHADIEIENLSKEDKYYHLNFYQELSEYRISITGDTLLEATVYSDPITFDITNDRINFISYFESRGALIKDNTRTGGKLIVPCKGQYFIDRGKYLPGNLIVELRTVSKEYYLFHKSLITQQLTLGDPFAENVNPFNNINNGQGVFAGFSVKHQPVRIPE